MSSAPDGLDPVARKILAEGDGERKDIARQWWVNLTQQGVVNQVPVEIAMVYKLQNIENLLTRLCDILGAAEIQPAAGWSGTPPQQQE